MGAPDPVRLRVRPVEPVDRPEAPGPDDEHGEALHRLQAVRVADGHRNRRPAHRQRVDRQQGIGHLDPGYRLVAR